MTDRLMGDEEATAWASNLLQERDLPAEPLTLLKGWTNRVWLSPFHVVRLSSGRHRESFAHEIRVEELVRGKVPVPPILDHGLIEGEVEGQANSREWMVSKRLPGQSLLMAWPDMAAAQRHDAVRQLGRALKTLHQVELPQALENPWLSDAIGPDGKPEDGYRIAPRHYRLTTDNLRRLGLIEESLIARAEAFMAERQILFEDDTDVLIHSDPHFNNLLWDGKTLTLIDFEASTRAPRDRELQTLIDYCWRNPSMVYAQATPQQERKVGRADVTHVVDDIRTVYPEMFEIPNLRQRLEVYDMMTQLHQLQHFAPGSDYDPRPALEQALDGVFDFPDTID